MLSMSQISQVVWQRVRRQRCHSSTSPSHHPKSWVAPVREWARLLLTTTVVFAGPYVLVQIQGSCPAEWKTLNPISQP
jgi:hypothetical protein